MAKAKKVVRRAWTKDDVRTMKTMAKAKSGVAKIAKVLKRTPGATTVMAAKLGISLSVRDEELANFRNNLADIDSLLNVRFTPPGAVARGSF